MSPRIQLICIIQNIQPENRIRIVKDLTRAWAHRLRKKTYFVYKELWYLRKFIIKLLSHFSEICPTVLSNSLIWPSLYAINYSMSNMKLCGLYDCNTLFGIVYNGGLPVILCFSLFYVFTPSFLIPFLQGTYERYNHAMLISRCSPIIKQSEKKHSMYYTTMNPYDEKHKDA